MWAWVRKSMFATTVSDAVGAPRAHRQSAISLWPASSECYDCLNYSVRLPQQYPKRVVVVCTLSLRVFRFTLIFLTSFIGRRLNNCLSTPFFIRRNYLMEICKCHGLAIQCALHAWVLRGRVEPLWMLIHI